MAIPNIVIPAGKLYFQREDASGNLTGGEHYLAETPELTFLINPNQLEVLSADTATEELILDITTKVAREGSFSTRDISDDALALFALGTQVTKTQAATPVTGESLGTLEKGAYYQIGTTASNPSGIRGCSAVTVKAAGVACTLGTDYTLDATLGRVYILPSTVKAAGAALTVDYTPAVNSRTQVQSSEMQAVSIGLRYIANNTQGANRDIYWPRATLVPNGNIALKGREVQKVAFNFKVKTRTLADGTVLAPVYIDGRP